MPMPKRKSVDDFFTQVADVQRPHLEQLRELSRSADPKAREELKYNLPVYVRGDNANLWMLQTALDGGGAHMTLIALWDGKGGDGSGGTQHMTMWSKIVGRKG